MTVGSAVDGSAAPGLSDGATLQQVLRNLGLELLTVLAAPRGLDVPVGNVVIQDPFEAVAAFADDVVLGIGLDPADHRTERLLTDAGAAGAAAVVLKLRDSPADRLVELAERAGVTLLSANPELAWGQLHSLLRSASVSAGHAGGTAVDGIALGDLFSLANAIAAMVGGPTTIEDPQARVLAYSNLEQVVDEPRRETILGRRVPDEWLRRLQEAGVFRQLWTTDEVVPFDAIADLGLQRRLAIAVRAGDEILGQIWVAEGAKPLGPEAVAALTEASRIAALHLVRYRATRNLEHRARGELLRTVLSGGGVPPSVVAKLGLEASDRFVVLAVELQSEGDTEVALHRERVLDLLAGFWEAYRRRSAQVAIGRTVYVLLPVRDEKHDLVRLAEDFALRARGAVSVPVTVGIGSVVADLHALARSRCEADQVLRVLAAEARWGSVAAIDDVRSRVALLELGDVLAERPHLRLRQVDLLVVHDREHRTAYVETLSAWLNAFGDVAGAAEAVHVHPNTFRYRLRRLGELSGLNIWNPDERLLAQLHLRLLDRADPPR